ncbi:MAG: hypothetical protein ACQEXJ_09525 [Myxococcota bacterium]
MPRSTSLLVVSLLVLAVARPLPARADIGHQQVSLMLRAGKMAQIHPTDFFGQYERLPEQGPAPGLRLAYHVRVRPYIEVGLHAEYEVLFDPHGWDGSRTRTHDLSLLAGIAFLPYVGRESNGWRFGVYAGKAWCWHPISATDGVRVEGILQKGWLVSDRWEVVVGLSALGTWSRRDRSHDFFWTLQAAGFLDVGVQFGGR